uniref:Extensin-like n=1 Tax=Nicotiana sylvestris TaxID=4096 RepID=A0A1U7YF49_NICSY
SKPSSSSPKSPLFRPPQPTSSCSSSLSSRRPNNPAQHHRRPPTLPVPASPASRPKTTSLSPPPSPKNHLWNQQKLSPN